MKFITDILSEIQLSPVAREKLVTANEHVAALESDNISLKKQISDLEVRLEQCQQQRQELEEQIKEKSFHEQRLDPLQENILQFLAQQGYIPEPQIVSVLNVSAQLAQSHLQELQANKLADTLKPISIPLLHSSSDDNPPPIEWRITQKGRRYLVQHGLLT